MSPTDLRTAPNMNRTPDGFEIKGWHVLAALILFFGSIFAVNGIFLYEALSTHTGVISTQPYRKGLDYNSRIAFEKEMEARGWTEEVVIDENRDGLTLSLADKHGRPVSGLRIAGFVGRPSTEQQDIALTLAETAPGSGHYRAAVHPLEIGAWMIDLEATEMTSEGTEKPVYRLRKRLWVKPGA